VAMTLVDPDCPKFCECPETLSRGARFPSPPGHDCEYVRQRSALVPQASSEGHSTLSFALASSSVCHCMFEGQSQPPRFNGMM